MVYRFRVTYEEHEDVYRDIDIKPGQSFIEFHSAIQQAISFDNSKAASFYQSDDYWRKEEEIISVNTNEQIKKPKAKTEEPPKKKTIADFVESPHHKFVYVFDPEKEWTFTIELIKILPDEKKDYPVCSKSNGTAPKQYKETTPPPPLPEEEDEPKTEKEETAVSVEEKISEDDDTEAMIKLEDGEVKPEEGEGDKEEESGDTEEGESSEGFEFDDDD